MNTQYFEGIIQIREATEEIYEFIRHELRKNPNVKVSDEKPIANGSDLYITDRRFTQRLGKSLKKKFGGEMRVSPTLHTRDGQTSKDLYRVTVYYHYIKPDFKTICIRGEEFKVLSQNTKVYVQNVKTGEKKYITFETLYEAEKKKIEAEKNIEKFEKR